MQDLWILHTIFFSGRDEKILKKNKKKQLHYKIFQAFFFWMNVMGFSVYTTFQGLYREELRVGKKMKDRSQYPLSLTLPEYNLKIQSSLAVENDAFILYVNSVNFLTLPYKYDMTKERDP